MRYRNGEEGRLSREMIKAKVMELQVVDVVLATSWRDEETAGRCEEQPKPKAKAKTEAKAKA